MTLSSEKLFSGNYSGVFIDDTGTPGQTSSSRHLHSDRKSWVAVLLTPEQMHEVYKEMPMAIKEFKKQFGVGEFHFTDIYSGKKAFKGIDLNLRLSIFKFMAYIFSQYRFPIIIQTVNPDNISEHQHKLAQITINEFNPMKPADFALLLLLNYICKYLSDNMTVFTKLAYFFVDEGFRKADVSVTIPILNNVAVDSSMHFAESSNIFPLQLADFAAFSINRIQWILAKKHRTSLDDRLLHILQGADFQVINLPKVEIDISSWSYEDYNAFIENDRKNKGLRPQPWSDDDGKNNC